MGGSTLANRVRSMRDQRDHMTQQALADAVGVSRQTIIAIEQGRYSPSLEVALKIAQAFGEPVEQVFWFTEGVDSQTMIGNLQ
ncbi:MAG TPA: helix-turn-helix transcriptional regulator [Wenzhouxiangellaceae bacterium]|nr:helix-turn-helix transcriptional regulator [Wenzhouxiangellaceae bacterium]